MRSPPSPGFVRHSLASLGALAAVSLVATPGCAAGAATDPAKTAPARQAVVTFLDALKKGDDAAARGMLTKVARAKTEELGISVAPPVNDTATYSVRDCEMIGQAEDLVHVATTWTDVDSDGFKSTENVVWVVRLEPEGWRVVGMAMRVFEDLPPLLLNFEDPEDMIAKQEMVAAELHKRARAAESAQPQSRTARGEAAPATRQ